MPVCQGLNSSRSCLNKFGAAPSFATVDGEVTLWDGADGLDIAEYQYNYSPDNTANIDSISSTSTGDTQSVEIQGLDANYNLVIQTKTLTGQVRAALDTPLIRVFRVKNKGATNFAGYVYVYVNTALSGGRPIDTTQIRAAVDNGNNQTLMSLYSVPDGTSLYMTGFHFSIDAGNKVSNYIVRLRVRDFGGVFRIIWTGALSDAGNSFVQYFYSSPLKIDAKSDIEMTATATAAGVTLASVAGSFEGILVTE
jgi:hypothetical protein